MLELNIDPVLLRIGSFELRWYGLMVDIAVITIILITAREARRLSIPREDIYSVGIWAVVAGILGSRLVHVVDQWQYYLENPSKIIGFEGLGVYGAILGALLAVLIYCIVKKISFWRMGDAVAPGAVMGQAIGRVGCVLAGCCYGLPTEFECAVTYTNPGSYAPVGLPVYPTQLMLLAWNLVVFALLWSVRKRLKPEGALFLLYLSLYALGDFLIRYFREGTQFFLNFQEAQVIGLAIMAVTVPWFIWKVLKGRKRATEIDKSQVKKESGQES